MIDGEGEFKVNGKERRRIWRKRHLPVNSKTYEVICANLWLNNMTNAEDIPCLIRQTHLKISSAAANVAYDTRLCRDSAGERKQCAVEMDNEV